MAIKMRHCRDNGAKCCSCGASVGESLGMYDIMVGTNLFTVCDVCNEQLLNKTLRAEVNKNGRAKSAHDMAIIRHRKHAGGG